MKLSKNIDITFVIGPKCEIDNPPLGVACLCSYLKTNGYSSSVRDLNLDYYLSCSPGQKKLWSIGQGLEWNSPGIVRDFLKKNKTIISAFLKYTAAEKPAVVGFVTWETNFYANLIIAAEIKKNFPAVNIIIGGPEISFRVKGGRLFYKECGFVDAFVIGEGEETVKEILQRVRDKRGISGCAGTAFFKKHKLIIQPDRAAMNINTLPVPDFSGFNLEAYSSGGTLPFYSSRGCLNKCIYCNERNLLGPYRSKTGKRLFEEVRQLAADYPRMKKVIFCDSLINGNIKELIIFCRLMVQSGLKLEFDGLAVIRNEMNEKILKLMFRAGFKRLGYGVECVSHELLERAGKVLSRGCDIQKIIRDTYRAGIGAYVNFMFGLPGENEKDAEENIKFVIRNKKYIDTVVPSYSLCFFGELSDGYINAEKYGLKMCGKGFFWESCDGKNNYSVRVERFDNFCRRMNENKVKIFPFAKIPDINKNLGGYYFNKREFNLAAQFLKKALKDEPENLKILSMLSICRNALQRPLNAITG